MKRALLHDVLRLSHGQPTSSKLGSRGIPHRLNQAESKQFELARSKGYLTLTGSGHRRSRAGSPLSNIFRLYCDASNLPAISLHKSTIPNQDYIDVDVSPLRLSTNTLQSSLLASLSSPSPPPPLPSLPPSDWEELPIHSLPPIVATYPSLSRSEAKSTAAALAAFLETASPDAPAPSTKSPHVKAGKSRRSGGWGIGGQ
ncbi:hypothetical protein TeGR_g1234 [Tetraparma gracilis]|uniref:Uncharacterized protein n=1 Tax=Tetraparma gracilis TaxID=2962635 RepID=A0ABQ6MKL9_9STRA|nr:hypothetical protein TeGR_g1234 [Tetraparma gracilis]